MKGWQSFLGFVFFFLLHEVKLAFELKLEKRQVAVFFVTITTVEARYLETLGEKNRF